jgi:hypothetical protein
MTTFLTLGGILFADFEVPEKINFGGKQMLTSHKLIGGQRVIDAMGPDDDNTTWSGRFRGAGAEIRARQLNLLRRQGQPQTLSWSTLLYSVMIEDFRADFQQPYEIPYTISVMVIEDLSNPLDPAPLTPDIAISDDLNNILQVGTSLNLPGVTTAISGVVSATSTIQTYQGAASSVIAGVQSAVGTAQSVTSGAITTAASSLLSSGDITGGASPTALVSSLTAQASSFSQLGQLYQIKSSLGRMATNLTNGAT